MNFIVTNGIVKPVGRAIGAAPFNSQTSGCDVMHNGKACCSNSATKQEVKKSGLPYCKNVK